MRPPRSGDGRIEGPVVSLRRATDADLADLYRWRHDPEVARWWDHPPDSLAVVRAEHVAPDPQEPVWCYMIEHRGRAVGWMQYHHPSRDPDEDRSAGMDILIGAEGPRGHGLGTEAVRTMLRYLFEVIGIERATIDPETGNARAIRAYTKAGFRLEGILRRHAIVGDRVVDTYLMAMLAEEWPAARARWEAERADTAVLRIESLEGATRAAALTLITQRYGSTRLATAGRLHDAALLPGFAALDAGGRFLGATTYAIEPALVAPACEVVTLDAVTPGARLGVGRALLDAVGTAARESGCRRLWLVMTNDHTAALRFYQRLGWRLSALHPGAADEARRTLKPELPAYGMDGIPIRDEWELEFPLVAGAGGPGEPV